MKRRAEERLLELQFPAIGALADAIGAESQQLDRKGLRRGREMKRASGGYAAGRPRYGYSADDGSLVAVPEEQRAIKLAKQLRKRGLSLRQIADRLEAEGLLPRSGGLWHPPMVSGLVNSKAKM